MGESDRFLLLSVPRRLTGEKPALTGPGDDASVEAAADPGPEPRRASSALASEKLRRGSMPGREPWRDGPSGLRAGPSWGGLDARAGAAFAPGESSLRLSAAKDSSTSWASIASCSESPASAVCNLCRVSGSETERWPSAGCFCKAATRLASPASLPMRRAADADALMEACVALSGVPPSLESALLSAERRCARLDSRLRLCLLSLGLQLGLLHLAVLVEPVDPLELGERRGLEAAMALFLLVEAATRCCRSSRRPNLDAHAWHRADWRPSAVRWSCLCDPGWPARTRRHQPGHLGSDPALHVRAQRLRPHRRVQVAKDSVRATFASWRCDSE
ncbi:hypothetical protein L1887_63210 [Cichorium endivia]|nr:hypothetical protein L1887_63210 [Cichorium endivia]